MRRRTFLQRASVWAGATAVGAVNRAYAEPAPEIRRIRLVFAETMCLAPQYLAEALLYAEGFEQVEYVPIQLITGKYSSIWIPDMLGHGAVDVTMTAAPGLLPAIDSDAPVVVIAGIHGGCYELFGNGDVRTVKGLRGRTVAVAGAGDEKLFISAMMSYVGMDPRKDVTWVQTSSLDESMKLFVDRKVDAFLGFPPQPQQLRAQRIGHMFLSTASDRPWSQYFCCVVAANRDFARKYPIATKRALRALLKAADICAEQPERAARFMIDKGYVTDMKYAMNLLTDLPYDRWRTSDPEDTLRFYALRLHEIGTLKNGPQKLIERGTNWRFLNELKKELKT